MECSATQWSAQGQPWKNTGLLQSSALSSRLCENTKQAHRGELFGFAAPRNLGQMSVERHEIAPASGPLAFSHTLSSQPDEQVHPSEGEANQWVFSGASEANSNLKLRRHKHLKICLSHPLVPSTPDVTIRIGRPQFGKVLPQRSHQLAATVDKKSAS
jgi:hypothetical protein